MKIISVWGSPGSGKTTLAIEIAKKIAKRSINCLVLFTDDFVSPVNYLLPSLENMGGSIGDILMNSSVVQSEILRSLIPVSDNKYLCFSGYRKCESKFNYSDISEAQVADLFVSLNQLVDCVVVDCVSNFNHDLISKYALEAGQCIQVGGGDYKSITYFQNCRNFIHNYTGMTERNMIVVNNPWDFDCWMTVANQYGGEVEFAFPFCMDIQQNYLEERSLTELASSRINKGFMTELNQLVDLLVPVYPVLTTEQAKAREKGKTHKKSKKEKPMKERRKFFKKRRKGADLNE